MTEKQRALALQLSGTSGGDGSAVYLSAYVGAVIDIAQNENTEEFVYQVTEFDDVIPPIILSARIDFSTGILTLTANETLDVTPASNVNLSLIHFFNSTTRDVIIDCIGSDVIEKDGETITIRLPEVKRHKLYKLSNQTVNGDGTPLIMDVQFGAFQDVALNDVVEAREFFVLEMPDIVPPSLLSGTVNYSTGLVVLQFSETIDVTPVSKVNLNRIFLEDSSGGGGRIYLGGATVEGGQG